MGRRHEEEVQRLISQADGYAKRVEELEGQLARTQEWLERFQGAVAAQELELHELRPMARILRMLLVEADSNLALWCYRYDWVRMPDDLRAEVDDLRRRIHPYVSAGGRGATGDTAVSNTVTETFAGSNPAAPTGAVQVHRCPECDPDALTHDIERGDTRW